jgi:two-component system LytT family response regulator
MNNSMTSQKMEYSLPVATAEGLYFFKSDEIVRLEASSNYTYIHFTNRRPLLIAKVLGDYEELLSSLGFIRTHRSHLVNRKHILFIDSEGNIIMQDESKAEISRRKKKDVIRQLKNHFLQYSPAA